MKFNLIGLSILIIPFLIIGCDSNSSESSHLENTNSQQTNNELIIVPYSKEETPKVYKQWGSKWVEKINQMMPQAVEKIKGNPKCDAPESVILSEQKSRVKKEAIFIVDCINRERFYVSQKELQNDKPIKAQTDVLGEPSQYIKTCQDKLKKSLDYPVSFETDGMTMRKAPIGNIEIILPYSVQGQKTNNLAVRCLVTTENKIEINPIKRQY